MILVTGATGLVGGNLVWHLLQKNERIIAIKRPTSSLNPLRTIFKFYGANPEEFLERIEWRTADVLDTESLQEAMNGITTVYHCAAVVSLGSGAESLIDTNVIGTRNIVQTAIKNKVEKLCFVSSIASCGSGNGLIDENTAWIDSHKRSAYSRSKYLSEQEVWAGIKSGLNAVIVNPGVILGVSGSNTGSSQLFAQVKKGLQFYTNGGSGYVDVQDVVKAMIQLTGATISGERFILAAENSSNRDILKWMADGFDKPRPFIGIGRKTLWMVGLVSEIFGKLFRFQPLVDRGTARSATHREYYSSAKIQQAIGFKFKPVEQCIQEVCDFEKRNTTI